MAAKSSPPSRLKPAPTSAEDQSRLKPAPTPVGDLEVVSAADLEVVGAGFSRLESEPRTRYLRYSPFFIRPSSQTTIEATVSLPWIVEMSKPSMRRGIDGRPIATRSVSSASKWAAMFSLNLVR